MLKAYKERLAYKVSKVPKAPPEPKVSLVYKDKQVLKEKLVNPVRKAFRV